MPNIRTKTTEGTPGGSGTISGYASTWTREPDSWGDVVAKGAFAKALGRIEAEGKALPLLWNHGADDLKSYIGTVTRLAEDDHGLYFEADFDATPEAQRARELAMDGRLCKFSFAYDVIDQMEVDLGDGRRANELRELDIFEVSLVMYPANPDTSVVEVKGAAPSGKSGRRNSKADEDELRGISAALTECVSRVDALIGDETGADGGDEPAEGGEGEATPEGREAGEADIEAYRKRALLSAYGSKTKKKEGENA